MKRLFLALILGLIIGACGAVMVQKVSEFANNVRIITDIKTYQSNMPVMITGDD